MLHNKLSAVNINRTILIYHLILFSFWKVLFWHFFNTYIVASKKVSAQSHRVSERRTHAAYYVRKPMDHGYLYFIGS